MAVGASLVYTTEMDTFEKIRTSGAVMTSGLVLIVLCGVRNTICNKYII